MRRQSKLTIGSKSALTASFLLINLVGMELKIPLKHFLVVSTCSRRPAALSSGSLTSLKTTSSDLIDHLPGSRRVGLSQLRVNSSSVNVAQSGGPRSEGIVYVALP